MVFGGGKNAERGDVGAGGGVGVISIESRFVGRAGGGIIFLFDNAVLYCFAWRERV